MSHRSHFSPTGGEQPGLPSSVVSDQLSSPRPCMNSLACIGEQRHTCTATCKAEPNITMKGKLRRGRRLIRRSRCDARTADGGALGSADRGDSALHAGVYMHCYILKINTQNKPPTPPADLGVMPIYIRTPNRLRISVEVLVDIDMLHVQNSLRPVGGCGCSTDFGPTASDQYRERIKPRPREPSGRPVIEINISIIVRQRDALSKELSRGRPPYSSHTIRTMYPSFAHCYS